MMSDNFQYFSRDELACKCGCGDANMDVKFMSKVIQVRELLGFPFRVISAKRCSEHNSKVSSTGPHGPHTTGRALDIAAMSRQRYQIMAELQKLGMTRFGISQTSIHCDDLTEEDGFDAQVIWRF